jgi:trk system potassium uptake protein TrkH
VKNTYALESLLRWQLSPYQVLVVGFAGLILIGAFLLTTPWASQSGQGTGFLDALFTSTSAVCVTGLVVLDTGTHYSLFGQLVIIALIQFGGLGVMTLSTLLAVMMGKKIHLRERLLIQEATNQLELSGVVRLVLYIVKITLLVEFIGGTILAVRWYLDYGAKGIYYGYWHGVSAFCNAGFDLFGGFVSLTKYVDDLAVILTIAGLIIVGGIGFTVIADVWDKRRFDRLTLHSKMALAVTGLLIIAGTLIIMAFESVDQAVLSELTLKAKVLGGFFQSVTARTAGFNSVDIGSLREGTLLIIIILMYIGASPSSTGGGIKTTTAGVIALAVFSFIRGKKDTEVFHRQISSSAITKAVAIAVVSAGLIVVVTLAMTFTEQVPLLNILFEVTSAFGTVGLSTGITPSLSPAGKMMIILTMFAGRVGTLTLVLSLVLAKPNGTIHYPEGKVIIG